MNEQGIQRTILQWLAKQDNCWVIKTITTNKNGTPDILACFEGHFVAIEVKRPGNGPTKLQEYQLDQIRAAGGLSTVACSLAEVKKFIEDNFLQQKKI